MLHTFGVRVGLSRIEAEGTANPKPLILTPELQIDVEKPEEWFTSAIRR